MHEIRQSSSGNCTQSEDHISHSENVTKTDEKQFPVWHAGYICSRETFFMTFGSSSQVWNVKWWQLWEKLSCLASLGWIKNTDLFRWAGYGDMSSLVAGLSGCGCVLCKQDCFSGSADRHHHNISNLENKCDQSPAVQWREKANSKDATNFVK